LRANSEADANFKSAARDKAGESAVAADEAKSKRDGRDDEK